MYDEADLDLLRNKQYDLPCKVARYHYAMRHDVDVIRNLHQVQEAKELLVQIEAYRLLAAQLYHQNSPFQ